MFVLSEDGSKVAFRPVEIGILQGDVVQVRGEGVVGRVVGLGQQQLEGGAQVAPEPAPEPSPPGTRAASREPGSGG